jgi:hypothetical protein
MQKINPEPNLTAMFEGYLQTPLLWSDAAIGGLKQFPLELNSPHLVHFKQHETRLRLGKWVEKFVAIQLKHLENTKMIAEGLQIKKDKTTIGELDIVCLQSGIPIHLEVVYKFYLYDPNVMTEDPLAKWIGPNRKDNLPLKLNKLIQKQLPLLYHPNTKDYLSKAEISVELAEQYVHFKGQLFLPYGTDKTVGDKLNQSCVVGYYMNIKLIEILKDYKVYIPQKLEWLIVPHLDVEWSPLDLALKIVEIEISHKHSPMLWIKKGNGKIDKCFITWW